MCTLTSECSRALADLLLKVKPKQRGSWLDDVLKRPSGGYASPVDDEWVDLTGELKSAIEGSFLLHEGDPFPCPRLRREDRGRGDQGRCWQPN